MDVLVFQGWAEPLAEAGAGVLPIGRYYKSPLLSQDICDLENQNILPDVMSIEEEHGAWSSDQ